MKTSVPFGGKYTKTTVLFEQKSKCISSLSASQQYPNPSTTANAVLLDKVGGSKIKQFVLTSRSRKTAVATEPPMLIINTLEP
jgi:hypothetical protein